jgi:hypothetical protein
MKTTASTRIDRKWRTTVRLPSGASTSISDA